MKLNNKGIATSFILLLLLLIILGVYYFMEPYFNKAVNASRKRSFVSTARNYVTGARNMWVQGDLECQETGDKSLFVNSSEIGNGTYYILINQASINVPNINDIVVEKYKKSPFGNGEEVHGYVKIVYNGSDPVYSIYLYDSKHLINGVDKNVNSLTVDDIEKNKEEFIDFGSYDWHFCRRPM